MNLCLASRALRSEPQNEWAALGAAHEKVGKIPESQIVEYIYDFARTYFIRNSWEKPVPAAAGGGQKNQTAHGQKISSPKTPPFFARSPEKFLWRKMENIIVFSKNISEWF